jgi:hypothetical protein
MMECQLEVIFYTTGPDGRKEEHAARTFFAYDKDKAYCDGMNFDDMLGEMIDQGYDRIKEEIPDYAVDCVCRLIIPVNMAYLKD